jgi:acetolactate synthase-1/2/3 large subunit
MGFARPVSAWLHASTSARNVAADAARAVQAARAAPGQIATLILPADTAWNENGEVGAPLRVPARPAVAPDLLATIARTLRSREPAMLMLSGQALSEDGLYAAHRVAHVSGAKLRTPTQIQHMVRGRGRVPVDRIPYVVDNALKVLAGTRHVILVGAKPPTAFFAYPGKPSLVSPPDAQVHMLARPEQDAVAALEWLADELGAPKSVPIPDTGTKPQLVRGKFEPEPFAHTLAALLPENCIVAEDAVTSGRALFAPTFGAAPHDWVQNTGGAIGIGFPLATGAAVACPGRKVVCLQADGAGMYTLQALWTQAREKLDVTTVIFANRSYAILNIELARVGAQNPGPTALSMLDLHNPTLDWVRLASGMGVEASRAETVEEFASQLDSAMKQRGPRLIEVVL